MNILNTSLRPIQLAYNAKGVKDEVRQVKVFLIPGQVTEIAEKDWQEFNKNEGIKNFFEKGWLVKVASEKAKPVEPAEVEEAEELNATEGAIKLAGEYGVDLIDVEPNASGKITAADVKKHVAEKDEEL